MAEESRKVDDWDDFIGRRCGPDDRYEILRIVGQGGMGVVFEAVDRGSSKGVALKILRPEVCNEGEILQRFRREGSRFAKLRHKNIVSVHGMGRCAGRLYIASEFIRGKDLYRYRKTNGEFAVDHALAVISDVANGLSAAHSSGVVHRDLKPENIMLTDANEVKILDFGIAKDLNSTVGLTIYGAYLGTPGYSAPEQINGEDVDGRADIFSLGVILYELITGKLAFSGNKTEEVFQKTKTHDPLKEPSLQNVESPVIQLLGKMMRKKARHRYASCEDLNDAIAKTREWLRTGYAEEERPSLITKLKDLFGL